MGICTIKIFILLIIFGIVSQCSSRKPGQAAGYQNFVEERCRNNVPETTFKDKMDEINKAQHDVLIMTRLLPSQKETFCSDSTLMPMTISLNNYAEALMECFPKEEEYIPKFVKKSYNEYLNLLCASDGKFVDDLFSSEANACSKKQKEENVEECEYRLTVPLNATLTKNQICSDLKSIEKCYTENIQKHCSNPTNYISVISKIFGAINKPCNAVEDTSEEEAK